MKAAASTLLRGAVERGGPILCGWCTIPAQLTAEAVQHSGADILFVDGQHGMMGWDTVLRLVEAITPGPCPVLVRVPSQSEPEIMHALDAGADGVIVPFVNTAEEAGRAARACRYPPWGTRSWGPTRRMARGDYDTEAANAGVFCMVMIETPQAVAAASGIAAADGVDGVLLGGNDLALTMATPGRSAAEVRVSDEYHRARVAVAEACISAGIIGAAPGATTVDARAAIEIGYRMLIMPSDAAVLRLGLGEYIAAVRGVTPPATAAHSGY